MHSVHHTLARSRRENRILRRPASPLVSACRLLLPAARPILPAVPLSPSLGRRALFFSCSHLVLVPYLRRRRHAPDPRVMGGGNQLSWCPFIPLSFDRCCRSLVRTKQMGTQVKSMSGQKGGENEEKEKETGGFTKVSRTA